MQPLFLHSVSNKAWINRKYSCTLLSLVPVTLGPFFAPSLSPGTSLLGRMKKTTQFSLSPVYSTASPTCQSNTWQQLKSEEWKEREKKRKDVRRANKFEQTPSGVSRSLLAVVRRVMIVGNLGTQSPSVGPNPPISLRERGSRAEEKGGIVARDSAVKRGAYSTKLRSRQDNGCPSLAHSHTVSTQLYQTPLSFLPPLLCSVLSLSFLSRRPFFSSSQRDGG